MAGLADGTPNAIPSVLPTLRVLRKEGGNLRELVLASEKGDDRTIRAIAKELLDLVPRESQRKYLVGCLTWGGRLTPRQRVVVVQMASERLEAMEVERAEEERAAALQRAQGEARSSIPAVGFYSRKAMLERRAHWERLRDDGWPQAEAEIAKLDARLGEDK